MVCRDSLKDPSEMPGLKTAGLIMAGMLQGRPGCYRDLYKGLLLPGERYFKLLVLEAAFRVTGASAPVV